MFRAATVRERGCPRFLTAAALKYGQPIRMIIPFFTLAMAAQHRQKTLRALAAGHVLVLAAALAALTGLSQGPMLLGQVALSMGIVEGALVIGWRLTQLPKSQALEFLLVSPLRPARLFLGESLVGVSRLALIGLAGLPVLGLAWMEGVLMLSDLPVLLIVPWIWGVVTGLGLALWAYEPGGVRRWGERLLAAATVLYLIVGVLAGEQLPRWVEGLPAPLGDWLVAGFRGLHESNPFGVLRYALEHPPHWSWVQLASLSLAGVVLALLLGWRCARRLQGHFQDLHYQPAVAKNERRAPVGEAPLTWWAVRRVSQYAGRINLWLAGGFGLLYAIYTVAEPVWPPWLGKQVFATFDRLGGLPLLTTALVLLAAVPAAFQYGLWDSCIQDRCRRLELLLLTGLEGSAYWEAAASAAWRRGRGYVAVALLLWSAGLASGRLTIVEVLAAGAAGLIMWSFYFALGFQAFARGLHANLLGLALTLVLPMAVAFLYQQGWADLAQWLPPGGVYEPGRGGVGWLWWIGPWLAGLATVLLARLGLAFCERDLRRWYDQHQGMKVMH